MSKWRKIGTFIPVNLLHIPLASFSLINILILCYHILYILILALLLRFSFSQLQNFSFLYFFYTSNNKMTLIYIWFKLSFIIRFFNCFLYIIKLGTLFIKANWSWLIFKSIKTLEIKSFELFILDLANDNISSWFFFFFLVIDLYSLISTIITQIFYYIRELVMPIGISTKVAEVEIEAYSVTKKFNISTCLI